MDITLICGDAHQNKQAFAKCTALITDPPYGYSAHAKQKDRFDYTRFTDNREVKGWQPLVHPPVVGDDKPFDPAPWLNFEHVVLWGYQFLAPRLPIGSVFCWNKKPESRRGKWLSDCELAWYSRNCGVYLFNHKWDGWNRASERGQKHLHPTQKPVALFRWIIEERLKLPDGSVVGDPFMGSGPCAVAVAELNAEGRSLGYVGCEIVPEYCAIAQQRVEAV